jgi:NO-binding membrane sensor protein with MHYT domain
MSENHNTTRNSTRWIVPALIVGLALWGAFVAVGAYLGGVRFGYDPTRGLVVALAVLAFLAFWGVLLYGRRRRGGG